MTPHRLLSISEAAQAGRPVPAGRWRHRPHGLHTTDPLLWVQPIVHLGEPHTFGGIACGPVDPHTGEIGPLEMHVADHPLDRTATCEAFAKFASILTRHMDSGFVARTRSDGQRATIEDNIPPTHLPRIVVTSTRTLEVFARLARRFAYLPDDAHPNVEQLRHAGRWLREIELAALRAGQSLTVDVADLLRETFVVPLPDREQGHTGALVAAIAHGPQAAWQAEQVPAGPTVDVDSADRLWAGHQQIQAAGRAGRHDLAAKARADLHCDYRHAAEAAAAVTTDALRLLDRLDEQPTFAAARRKEDEGAYLRAARFLHGPYRGWRRPVGTIVQNAADLRRRETARNIDDLRRDATEPGRRCSKWSDGEMVEGTRSRIEAQRIPTGGSTPTGRPQKTIAVDIDIELNSRVRPPPAGTQLLWAGDPNFQTQGTVADISGRTVTIRIVGRGARTVTAAETGTYDVWLPGRPPFIGRSQPIQAADLPLTHQDSA